MHSLNMQPLCLICALLPNKQHRLICGLQKLRELYLRDAYLPAVVNMLMLVLEGRLKLEVRMGSGPPTTFQRARVPSVTWGPGVRLEGTSLTMLDIKWCHPGTGRANSNWQGTNTWEVSKPVKPSQL